MPKRMLIDSSHPEETRVVVLDGQKVDEFDFEAASKRPLKGNIYLAKVTRVEPSLQAAFVEYGGNRQGFLAFSEIHPDYYQIPVADRLALLAEQEAEAKRRAEDEFESFDSIPGGDDATARSQNSFEVDENESSATAEASEDEEPVFENHPEGVQLAEAHSDDTADIAEAEAARVAEEPEPASEEIAPAPLSSEPAEISVAEDTTHDFDEHPFEEPHHEEAHDETSGEPYLNESESAEAIVDGEAIVDDVAAAGQEFGAEPAHTEQPAQALQAQRPSQRWTRRRHYKIQEVIKRRQIILVQVVKEERGNKGAALTTYLSLAGRYCVLMPNTPRGGGISRKITNPNDRKRLKSAAQALELQEGMGLIIRTAGENRTKVEIKRDYEYLLRMWDTIRELTLKSNAPACVYEEGDLIKRAIRDLYNKDVAEIVVEGDDGYRNAKDFMRMLMPSHAKNVKPYKEAVPLFQRHHIEAQLDAMFSPSVTLRSGGYIVINQTEALVSIDVNSGRATREHSIEDTAYKTNLEAADEIARQLRLRDLAGLIVIDFIDMEDGRNDRNVERRLRDAVKNDRARIQIGKISQFGLLEMSRQRLRAGVIAGSTVACPHCGGQGIVRSVESTSLRVLRALEEEGQKQRANELIVRVAGDVAIYTLNQKRRELARIESDYGVIIQFEPREGTMAGTFDLERVGQRAPEDRKPVPISAPIMEPEEVIEEEILEAEEFEGESEETIEEPVSQRGGEHQQRGDQQGEGGGRNRRRRRRRGRDRDRPQGPQQNGHAPHFENRSEATSEPALAPNAESNGDPLIPPSQEFRQEHSSQGNGQAGMPQGEGGRRRRRRRRRGNRGPRDGMPGSNEQTNRFEGPSDHESSHHEHADGVAREGNGHHEIADRTDMPVVTPNAPSEPVWSLAQETRAQPAPSAMATPEPRREFAPTHDAPASAERPSAAVEAPKAPEQPARKGWWQRTFKG